MRKLHAQPKAMEFIYSLSDYVTSIDTGRRDGKSAGKQGLIELLHEELLHLEGRIPTLDELAGQSAAKSKSAGKKLVRHNAQNLGGLLWIGAPM
jgi:hypothetical protein